MLASQSGNNVIGIKYPAKMVRVASRTSNNPRISMNQNARRPIIILNVKARKNALIPMKKLISNTKSELLTCKKPGKKKKKIKSIKILHIPEIILYAKAL